MADKQYVYAVARIRSKRIVPAIRCIFRAADGCKKTMTSVSSFLWRRAGERTA